MLPTNDDINDINDFYDDLLIPCTQGDARLLRSYQRPAVSHGTRTGQAPSIRVSNNQV